LRAWARTNLLWCIPAVKSEAELARLLEQDMDCFCSIRSSVNDAVFHVGAKVGVALCPDDGVEADTLFKNAEAALRKAKVSRRSLSVLCAR
jgi:predicted signal transduction protein with EAL and GGDEF domain